MIVLLTGAPCAGKGALAARLRRRGIPSAGAGAALRERARRDPDLAARLAAGELASDTELFDALSDAIAELDAPVVILDGIPRRAAQVGLALERFGDELAIVEVAASDVVRAARASARGICDPCAETGRIGESCPSCGTPFVARPDDHDPAVRARRDALYGEARAAIAGAASSLGVPWVTIDNERSLDAAETEFLALV